MKILVVGGGGREHALAWKLSADRSKPRVYCAPGNAGTRSVAENLDIGAEDLNGIRNWARRHRPHLVVIGPEAPLCAGLADVLAAEGLRVFGPTRAAARLEGSKLFAKEVMQAAGVPTARAASFADAPAALEHIRSLNAPCVIKADGLAAGKGVFVCATQAEAEQAVEEIMVARRFGDAGSQVLVEERLEGEEASILALVDGRTAVMLASSQDHKRVFNNDEGPNTGGMGAYSPAPIVDDALWPFIREEIFNRTLAELRRRNIVYRGVLYAGLMVTSDGPRVLEFNCRFGDPETQAVIPRVDGDLLPALEACVDGNLAPDIVRWKPEACVCVVMASGGYPGPYANDKIIEGIPDAEADGDVLVFQAGTRLDRRRLVTAGGRVLGVTALGARLPDAVRKAYRSILKIKFDQSQYRTDIASRALNDASRDRRPIPDEHPAATGEPQ